MPWVFLLKSVVALVLVGSMVACTDRKREPAPVSEPIAERSDVRTTVEKKDGAVGSETEFSPLQTSLLSFWGGDPNDLDSVLAALRKITSTVPGPAGDQTKAAYIVEVCKRAPRQLASLLPYVTDLQERLGSVQIVIRAWARNSPDEALQYANQTLTDRDKAMAQVAVALGFADGSHFARAGDVLDAMPSPRAKTLGLVHVIPQWVKISPAAAVEWYSQLDPPDQESALPNLLFELEAAKAIDPMVLLSNAVTPKLQPEVLKSAIRTLVNQGNSAAARGWIEQAPSEFQAVMQAAYIESSSPGSAEDLLGMALSIQEEHSRDDAIAAITLKVFARNPAKSADFVTDLPEASQPSAALNLVTRWYNTDPDAAAEWVMSLPVGTIRDIGLSEVARQLARTDPNGARRIAEQIHSDSRRAAVTRMISADQERRVP